MFLIIVFLLGYNYTNFVYKSQNEYNIIKWDFKSENVESNIKLSEEKIMPGSKGNFEIILNASGSEVDIEYQINVIEEKNIPHNLRFSAEKIDENYNSSLKTEWYETFNQLAMENLKGIINRNENNQVVKWLVHWNWEFNEEDTSAQDAIDASAIFENEDQTNLNCRLKIEIIGKQTNQTNNN